MTREIHQVRRYELKYTVTEEIAAGIRDYIKNYFSLDSNVKPGEKGYIVNNLYFDTLDLRFYHDTKHRKLTRYKPRARFYGEKATDIIYPEIKYRHNSVIWKRRYAMPVEEWPTLFHPQKSGQIETVFNSSIDTFEDLIHWYSAEPVLHVRYFREPYVTEIENYGRVTFDRQLSYAKANGSLDLGLNNRDLLFYDDPITTVSSDSPIILEIKVETLVPFWVSELIRTFNLRQRPFSKYCYGLDHHYGYEPLTRHAVFG